jgi:hypothetical protein
MGRYSIKLELGVSVFLGQKVHLGLPGRPEYQILHVPVFERKITLDINFGSIQLRWEIKPEIKVFVCFAVRLHFKVDTRHKLQIFKVVHDDRLSVVDCYIFDIPHQSVSYVPDPVELERNRAYIFRLECNNNICLEFTPLESRPSIYRLSCF